MKATAKKGADKTIANNKETLTALYSCSNMETIEAYRKATNKMKPMEIRR